MSVFSGTIFSKTLNKDTHLTVILPQDNKAHVEDSTLLAAGIVPRDIPRTLILLHPEQGNDMSWQRYTAIERYAQERDIAVVMPDCSLSFFQDMVYGAPFFQYITKEVPELMTQMFHVSVSARDLLIAGLGAGGYSALQCALTYPENYYASCATSPVADMKKYAQDNPKLLMPVLGKELKLPQSSDLQYLAEHMESAKTLPVYLAFGKEDVRCAALEETLEKTPEVALTCIVREDCSGWKLADLVIEEFLTQFVN